MKEIDNQPGHEYAFRNEKVCLKSKLLSRYDWKEPEMSLNSTITIKEDFTWKIKRTVDQLNKGFMWRQRHSK